MGRKNPSVSRESVKDNIIGTYFALSYLMSRLMILSLRGGEVETKLELAFENVKDDSLVAVVHLLGMNPADRKDIFAEIEKAIDEEGASIVYIPPPDSMRYMDNLFEFFRKRTLGSVLDEVSAEGFVAFHLKFRTFMEKNK